MILHIPRMIPHRAILITLTRANDDNCEQYLLGTLYRCNLIWLVADLRGYGQDGTRPDFRGTLSRTSEHAQVHTTIEEQFFLFVSIFVVILYVRHIII
jgi:hypothetical protein